METFDGYEVFSSVLVFVWVSENNSGKRSSTAWIMHNFLYDSPDVPIYKGLVSLVFSYPSLSAKSRVLN